MSTITKIETARIIERKYNIEKRMGEVEEHMGKIEVEIDICDTCGKELKHGNYVYSNGKHTCFNS